MRPVFLRMTAFGPYPGSEVVDFREAMKMGLFGIYGPTGSGKSSIFSAIAFALFGETADGVATAETVRSDHAAPSKPTNVEFIFDIGPKRYRVVRIPPQERPKAKGDGTTTERHQAYLFDITGLDPDAVSSENPGKVLAEKNIKAVSDEIHRILGYGADQFRKIVLLAQGKFSDFLAADTSTRLKILRQLFDVSLYEKLAIKLQEEHNEAAKRIRADRHFIEQSLAEHELSTLDELAELVAEKQGELEKLEQAATEKKKAYDETVKLLQSAEALEDKFKNRDQAQQSLQALVEKDQQIEALRERLSLAEKAQRAVDLDTEAKNARASLKARETALQMAQSEARAADQEAANAKQALTELEAVKPENEAKRVELPSLEAHRKALEKAAAHQQTRDAQNSQQAKAQEKVNALEESKTAVQAEQTEKKEDLTVARENAKAIEAISKNLLSLAEEKRLAEEYERAAGRANQAEEALKVSEAAIRKAENKVAGEKERFESAKAVWLGQQALQLAEILQDGHPCPVCGSIEHPHQATEAKEGSDAAEEYEQASETYDKAKEKRDQAIIEHRSNLETLEARRTERDELIKPEKAVSALSEEIDRLTRQRETLQMAPSVDTILEKLSELEATLETIGQELETANAKVSNAKAQANTEQALYDENIGAVPVEFRDQRKLAQRLETLTAEVSAFDASYEKALQRRNEASADQKLKAGAVASAEKEVEAARNSLQERECALLNRLEECGLTSEQFTEGRADIEKIDEMKTQCDEHAERKKTAQSRIAELSEVIGEQPRPVLKEYEDRKLSAEVASNQAQTAVGQASNATATLQRELTSLQERFYRIADEEKKIRRLGLLADECNGRNTQQMRLETFAVASMFDMVLEAANLRLGPMTGNRYKLQRKIEGKGRGQRGLEMAAFDVHTGKQRPVTTLSGGETFMAALALALGLSDIVQQTTGGIHIDAIFIDEGFGSLDAATLEEALQVLQNLVGDTRAVGLISHVEIVQQAIPQGFQIVKAANGSHVVPKHM